MTSREFHLHDGRKGAALAVRVTPRSRKNEVFEIMQDGTVRIRLTSPPADGLTNQALVEFLAGVLQVSPSNLEIVAGVSGRDKLVSVIGLDAQTVHERIISHLA